MPEYGRNIQGMVDHCLTITDRVERNRCARRIIASMANLYPELKGEANYHKLWDHLVIMSDFKLDVDFPCEVVEREQMSSQPEPLSRPAHNSRDRHYGTLLPAMVRHAASMPEGAERRMLVYYLANHMKKLMLAVSRDGVSDAKVFKDMAAMSDGAIAVDPATMPLNDYREILPQGRKKKKR